MGTKPQGDVLWIVIMHSNDKLVLIDAQRQNLTRPESVCTGNISYASYMTEK